MEEKEVVNIDKARNNMAAINWEKANKEIWDKIGWHNHGSKITNENWLENCEGALESYRSQIDQKHCPLGIARTCTYLRIVKALNINYNHPAFDLLQ